MFTLRPFIYIAFMIWLTFRNSGNLKVLFILLVIGGGFSLTNILLKLNCFEIVNDRILFNLGYVRTWSVEIKNIEKIVREHSPHGISRVLFKDQTGIPLVLGCPSFMKVKFFMEPFGVAVEWNDKN